MTIPKEITEYLKINPEDALEQIMFYRKSLSGKWHCSWNCGFTHEDVKKVKNNMRKVVLSL